LIGITSYSTYVPRYRLTRQAIAAAWAGRAMLGEKAVINFDEDALTMGQTAAWRLLQSAPGADALYFASTTAPYWQRSAASLIAAACDLPTEVATSDFGSSTRAGMAALRAAFDTVVAGSSKLALVVAADAREGAPESAEELLFGDAAAAFSVGRERVVAELLARISRTDDFLDEWRRDTDRFVNSFASKFSLTRGYEANAVAVGRALLEQAGLRPDQIARAAIASPDGRAHLAVAKALGIAAEKVEDARLGEIGVTGTAMPLLALAQALDQARAGEVILAIGYGEGADGFLLRATEELERLQRPVLKPARRTIEFPSYQVYRKLRDFTKTETGGAEVSNVLWEREEPQNVRLHGTLCPRCETVQFPITRVCVSCRNREGLIEKPLARTGHIFTFNRDYLYQAPAQPTFNAVVDLEGGGRFLCQMTDTAESEVEIGMLVELVLRRMRESETMHHYYWKCRPVE
jgi:3-hydroxy-3-methylglutaryl CoA synthase